MKTDVSAESGKSALALIGAATASLTLNQWVAIATGIYVVIQVAYLIRKWYREEKDWARGA
jgi:4-hydroxybenzoate polyprenyltransferase